MFTLKQIEDTVWYAPDIGDNLEKHETEQFAVQLATMNAAEMKRLTEARAGKVTSGKYNWLRRHHQVRDEILTRCVKSIRNLSMETVKDGRATISKITKVAELIEAAAPDSPADTVLEQILDALKDHSKLAEGIVGKSVSPSGLRTPATPPGSGVAPGAVGENVTQQPPSASGAPPEGATDSNLVSDSSGRPSSSAAPGPN